MVSLYCITLNAVINKCMLYVCDLYLDNRYSTNNRNSIPWGEFFMEFKQYPTFIEVCDYIIEHFPRQELGICGLSRNYASIPNKTSSSFCSGIITDSGDWVIRPTNIRALPKVRNKEKYLKNGGE